MCVQCGEVPAKGSAGALSSNDVGRWVGLPGPGPIGWSGGAGTGVFLPISSLQLLDVQESLGCLRIRIEVVICLEMK